MKDKNKLKVPNQETTPKNKFGRRHVPDRIGSTENDSNRTKKLNGA